MRKLHYPFVPRSTAYLREGQFWHIPLSDSSFACGRVLQFDLRNGKRHSRLFLAGLLDWHAMQLPTVESIAGSALLRQGLAHIQTVAWNNGAILGHRPLEADGLEPFLELSEWPHPGCKLLKGFDTLRQATLRERKTLYVQSGWGNEFIKLLAEEYFVEKTPPRRKLPWEEYLELKADTAQRY